MTVCYAWVQKGLMVKSIEYIQDLKNISHLEGAQLSLKKIFFTCTDCLRLNKD